MAADTIAKQVAVAYTFQAAVAICEAHIICVRAAVYTTHARFAPAAALPPADPPPHLSALQDPSLISTPPSTLSSTPELVRRDAPHNATVSRISAFYGIVITMYFGDHPPPHSHAKYGEHVAEIAIATLSSRRPAVGRVAHPGSVAGDLSGSARLGASTALRILDQRDIRPVVDGPTGSRTPKPSAGPLGPVVAGGSSFLRSRFTSSARRMSILPCSIRRSEETSRSSAVSFRIGSFGSRSGVTGAAPRLSITQVLVSGIL